MREPPEETGFQGVEGLDEHLDRWPRRALDRAVKLLRTESPGPEFARLLRYQASGAAGDALLALALAGSLFFSVPETAARGRVILYLALTVAPFAIVAPLLARVLDRFRGSLRWALVVSAVGRATLAWWLATRLESLYLFPIAFTILVLSRASLVVRGAALPLLIPEGGPLVTANASLSKVGGIAGMVAVAPGLLLIKLFGPDIELLFASLVYYAGALPALRLPSHKGFRSARDRVGARIHARTVSMRQAIFATAGMRFLVGFLVVHLAFALRREEFGSIGLGLLVASAATGGLIGALVAPRLRRTLREEGIIVAALVAAGLSGAAAGRWFSLVTAGLLVLVFGVTSGAAKVAFDSIVQREMPEGARGWAFARFESTLQLAWVGGALAPLVLPIPAGPGVFVAGVIANVLALLYTLGRYRARAASPPPALP